MDERVRSWRLISQKDKRVSEERRKVVRNRGFKTPYQIIERMQLRWYNSLDFSLDW